jgi:hypothetical protein
MERPIPPLNNEIYVGKVMMFSLWIIVSVFGVGRCFPHILLPLFSNLSCSNHRLGNQKELTLSTSSLLWKVATVCCIGF